LEHRFSDAYEFIVRLTELNKESLMEPDDLEIEIARLRELTESAVARELAEAAPSMEMANSELCGALDQTWRSAGLQWGGQNPIFKSAGAA
jgi:serine/threonine-protein kinase